MKWANPYDWVYDRIYELKRRMWRVGDQEALSQLTAMALLMAAELDHDQLQDLFQNAMDDEGYFDEPEPESKPEDTYRKLLDQGWSSSEAARQVDYEYGFEEERVW